MIYNIDVLNLQETEIKPDVPIKTLHIPGYTIEIETNVTKNGLQHTSLTKDLESVQKEDQHLNKKKKKSN